MSRTSPRGPQNRGNYLFPNGTSSPIGCVSFRTRIDTRAKCLATVTRAPACRPFATRHPVYRAAHRCISPVYRFGADVTALAKPLKSAEAGATDLAYHARVFQPILLTFIGLSLPSRRCHPVAPPGMPRENRKRRALMARSKRSCAKLREAIDGGAARFPRSCLKYSR